MIYKKGEKPVNWNWPKYYIIIGLIGKHGKTIIICDFHVSKQAIEKTEQVKESNGIGYDYMYYIYYIHTHIYTLHTHISHIKLPDIKKKNTLARINRRLDDTEIQRLKNLKTKQ